MWLPSTGTRVSTRSKGVSRPPTKCSEKLSNYAMGSQLVKGESGIRSQNYLAWKPHQGNKRCVSSSIVKPDPPKNLKLKPLKDSRHVEVSWEYPDTWSTPHSYFSLTFSLQIQGKNKRERVRCDSGARHAVIRFMQAHNRKGMNDDDNS